MSNICFWRSQLKAYNGTNFPFLQLVDMQTHYHLFPWIRTNYLSARGYLVEPDLSYTTCDILRFTISRYTLYFLTWVPCETCHNNDRYPSSAHNSREWLRAIRVMITLGWLAPAPTMIAKVLENYHRNTHTHQKIEHKKLAKWLLKAKAFTLKLILKMATSW